METLEALIPVESQRTNARTIDSGDGDFNASTFIFGDIEAFLSVRHLNVGLLATSCPYPNCGRVALLLHSATPHRL
jgi:hypothetical protein